MNHDNTLKVTLTTLHKIKTLLLTSLTCNRNTTHYTPHCTCHTKLKHINKNIFFNGNLHLT
jgi:hypothetical protein